MKPANIAFYAGFALLAFAMFQMMKCTLYTYAICFQSFLPPVDGPCEQLDLWCFAGKTVSILLRRKPKLHLASVRPQITPDSRLPSAP